MSTNIEKDDIDDLIPESHIALDDPPNEKSACIEYLLDLLVDAGRVDDREAALDALLAREEETTTGVGMGIGIPHAQTDAVSRPSVAFTRSDEGVDFGSMDDEPAKLLFMILVPKEGAEDHLAILSSLSRALMHEEVRDDLYAAETPAAVQAALREAVA
ncbi:PTS system, fructose-specific IIA component [Halogranum rubrum]|uniref:PTS system, fructose-specific IIA component n=2 Tax=Halogranum rubrum TaxID=553466 RepID=A0A1I4IQT4_9EURY|nr:MULTISPECIES: fructose PTS transporter subunit IIA [Halogranum]EJN57085.1 sugar hosphotransferase system IIA component [Halogranum salarium B-1]SFL56722.1 PTS system, fructose-specific IIA component [Halogranum rubrum]